jgi:tRNA(His) 5'-end guanylyltransferase
MSYLRIRNRAPRTNTQLNERYNITFQNGRWVVRFYLQPINSYVRRQDAEAHRNELLSAAR